MSSTSVIFTAANVPVPPVVATPEAKLYPPPPNKVTLPTSSALSLNIQYGGTAAVTGLLSFPCKSILYEYPPSPKFGKNLGSKVWFLVLASERIKSPDVKILNLLPCLIYEEGTVPVTTHLCFNKGPEFCTADWYDGGNNPLIVSVL